METKETGIKTVVECGIEKASSKELPYGQVEFVVSTGSVDRHGERINQEGINLKNYKGQVLWSHNYDALPIGKAIKIWKDKAEGSLKALVQFAVEENEFAKDVYKLIVGGYLKDASIGGLVEQWNEDYTVIEKLEMIEFSVCNIGANRDAGVFAKALGKSEDDFIKDYEFSVAKHLTQKLSVNNNEEISEWVKALKEITVALEGVVDSTSVTSAGEAKYKVLLKQAKTANNASEQLIKTIKVKLSKGE